MVNASSAIGATAFTAHHASSFCLVGFAMAAIVSMPVRPLSLLVVDDNLDVAESLAFVLRNDGFNVSIAYDGDQAFRMIDVSFYHVLICDIGLPGRSGYEVAARFRRLYGKGPLAVAISAYASENVKENAEKAGFSSFFSKPADPLALERMLRLHANGAVDDTKEMRVI
jgi:CheY-like chemotaxis protein